MATNSSRRSVGHGENISQNEVGRELFEACRNGDLSKVKKIVNTHNVNAKDTAGRKSSPLHFAAGLLIFFIQSINIKVYFYLFIFVMLVIVLDLY